MLRDLLKEKGMTQAEIAKKTGYTQGLISQWCNGVCTPKIADIKKLAEVLQVDVKEILECF